MEQPDDQRLKLEAAALGLLAAEHPLVARLKRLEETIREDPKLAALWADLQDAEDTNGGCGSGGCGSSEGG